MVSYVRSSASSPEKYCATLFGEGTLRMERFYASCPAFTTKAKVPDYLRCYLSELNREGCRICFVTTSPVLPDQELEYLKSVCDWIILRKNAGLDFASWKAGLDSIPVTADFKGVLLTNDSMLGPLRSLDREFSSLHEAKNCCIGMTTAWNLTAFAILLPLSSVGDVHSRECAEVSEGYPC